MTVAQLIDAYLAALRPTADRHYFGVVKCYALSFADVFGAQLAVDGKPEDLENWLAAKLADATVSTRAMGVQCVRRAFRAILGPASPYTMRKLRACVPVVEVPRALSISKTATVRELVDAYLARAEPLYRGLPWAPSTILNARRYGLSFAEVFGDQVAVEGLAGDLDVWLRAKFPGYGANSRTVAVAFVRRIFRDMLGQDSPYLARPFTRPRRQVDRRGPVAFDASMEAGG